LARRRLTNDYLILNPDSNVLSYDADANGKGDQVQIVKFQNVRWDVISAMFQNGFMRYNPEWEN